LEKTCPIATWSHTNPTSPDAGVNSGRCGGKPGTNRLSYGAATFTTLRSSPFHAQVEPDNGSVTVSVPLQITHGVFFSQSNSFLAIILQLPIPKTRLNSIPLLSASYPGRLSSRNSTFFLDYCSLFSLLLTVSFYNPSARTAQKTQPLF
jgi:hypothetical protein